MEKGIKQEEEFNKKNSEDAAATAKYQAELADYNSRKTKHDAAKNKPPTSDDVYAYINVASTGKIPGAVPGVEAPGPEPGPEPGSDSGPEPGSDSGPEPTTAESRVLGDDEKTIGPKIVVDLPLIDKDKPSDPGNIKTELSPNVDMLSELGYFDESNPLSDDWKKFKQTNDDKEAFVKKMLAKHKMFTKSMREKTEETAAVKDYAKKKDDNKWSISQSESGQLRGFYLPDGYTFHPARGDGNCLYHAVLEASYEKQVSPGYKEPFKKAISRVIPKDESDKWRKDRGEESNVNDESEEGKSHPMIQEILRQELAFFISSDQMKASCTDFAANFNKDGTEQQKENYNMLRTGILTMGNYGGFTEMSLIECKYGIKIKVFDARVRMDPDIQKGEQVGKELPENHPRWIRNPLEDSSATNVITLFWTGGHFDWLTKDSSSGGSKNPIMEATITAMSQFGGGEDNDDVVENKSDAPSSVDFTKIFSKCKPNRCKKFFGKLRDGNEFKKDVYSLESLLTEVEIQKLGGVSVPPQTGLITCIPQFDKVYNNTLLVSGNAEKDCLRCLYMGFIQLCKARDIQLDKVLQKDIALDYIPDIPTSSVSKTKEGDGSDDSSDSKTDDGSDGAIGDESDETDDSSDSEPNQSDGDRSDDAAGKNKKDKRLQLSGTAAIPVASPVKISTEKKGKYVWIKVEEATGKIQGVVANAYNSAEETIKPFINPAPSAPPVSSDNDASSNSNSLSSDGAAPNRAQQPISDSERDATAVNDMLEANSQDNDTDDTIGGCNNIPENTEKRPRPEPNNEKQGELWCKPSVSYLCGTQTNTYKKRLAKGLGAACRKTAHDCNYNNLPKGYSVDAENDGDYDPKFFTDDPSKKGISEDNITSCSKKTSGGNKKGGKRQRKKKITLKRRK